MKKQTLQFLLAAVAGSLVTTGCVSGNRAAVVREPRGEVVVVEPPPAPRREVYGAPLDSAHVWVQGYWAYANQKWVWIPGHWELPPRPGAAWVPGHWDRNPKGDGWTWTAGHWD